MTRHSQIGFSAIDLTIAMAISGMMIATAYRGIKEVGPRFQAKQAVQDLTSAIRTTRTRAILDKEPAIMPFDLSRDRYMVPARASSPNGTGGTVPNNRIATLPPGMHFVRPDSQSLTPVTLQPPGSQDKAAMFNPRGRLESLDKPGFIYVGNPEHHVYWRIRVDLAGNTRVERLDSQGMWR